METGHKHSNPEKSAQGNNFSLRQIWINTATDAAGHFAFGSGILTWPVNKPAACFNFFRSAMSFTTRLITEFEKADRTLPLPDEVRSFARNKGASLIVNATLTGLSGIYAGAHIQGSSFQDYLIPASLDLFSVSGITLGIGISLKNRSVMKTFLETTGIVTACMGMALAAGPITPAVVYMGYGIAALGSIALAMQHKKASGFNQPELIIGGTSLVAAFNAFKHDMTELGIANGIFVGGWWLLDQLHKYGGMVEWWNTRRGSKSAIQPPPPSI